MELVFVVPLLLTMFLALAQIGVMMSNLQYLPMASRAGAKVLAEAQVAALPTAGSDVRAAVDSVLASAGMSSSCVIVQQNASGSTTQILGSGGTAPTTPTLPLLGVRVTVFVPLSQLAPNLLSFIPFSLTNLTAQSTTTYPYERLPL